MSQHLDQDEIRQKFRKVKFKPEDLSSMQRRFTKAISFFSISSKVEDHIFDFDSGLRVIALQEMMDFRIAELKEMCGDQSDHPFLVLTVGGDGIISNPAKYSVFETADEFKVVGYRHVFDLTGILEPVSQAEAGGILGFYYCPKCVLRSVASFGSGKIPKTHCKDCDIFRSRV